MFKTILKVVFFSTIVYTGIELERRIIRPSKLLDRLDDLKEELLKTKAISKDQIDYLNMIYQNIVTIIRQGKLDLAVVEIDRLQSHFA